MSGIRPERGLREAFDYSYPEIAHILSLTPVSVRKIVSRARRHLTDDQRDSPSPPYPRFWPTVEVERACKDTVVRRVRDEGGSRNAVCPG
ncbi:sigma factor-like helix-turn-helix DNA-binding protein [Streptomyces sp. NPDC089424]|uniref:sigma factor-like helix-turn-helix DNA-binding protein n=1 Tax=Streptomyces sp. NPDC089424 TaxID=3365917 RepID=UPI003810FBAF